MRRRQIRGKLGFQVRRACAQLLEQIGLIGAHLGSQAVEPCLQRGIALQPHVFGGLDFVGQAALHCGQLSGLGCFACGQRGVDRGLNVRRCRQPRSGSGDLLRDLRGSDPGVRVHVRLDRISHILLVHAGGEFDVGDCSVDICLCRNSKAFCFCCQLRLLVLPDQLVNQTIWGIAVPKVNQLLASLITRNGVRVDPLVGGILRVRFGARADKLIDLLRRWIFIPKVSQHLRCFVCGNDALIGVVFGEGFNVFC